MRDRKAGSLLTKPRMLGPRQGSSRSYWALAPAIAVIFLGPLAVGVLPVRPLCLAGAAVLSAFSLYVLPRTATFPRAAGISLAAISVCLMITVLDLASHHLLTPFFFPARPPVTYWQPWPAMPLVHRFPPNVRWEGQTFGDLAAMTDNKNYREYRRLKFVTDRFGFRNGPPAPGNPSPDLDLIVLGDSFGAGSGTTQEDTWSSILAGKYGLETYNLSVDGEGPWGEFINLAVELERLRLKPDRTVLLWALFTGNDLDDPCYPTLKTADLPWNDRIGALKVSYGLFMARSPLRQLGKRAQWKLDRLLSHRNEIENRWIIDRQFLDSSQLLFIRNFAERKDRSLHEIQTHPNFACVKATIAAMKHLAASEHLTVVILLLPSKEEVYTWVLNRAPPWSTDSTPSSLSIALREISEREGIYFLDMKPFLIESSKKSFEDSRELLWWRDDSHWNSRGNREVAAFVYSKVLRSLVPGPEQPSARK